jgi:hypothetical protein
VTSTYYDKCQSTSDQERNVYVFNIIIKILVVKYKVLPRDEQYMFCLYLVNCEIQMKLECVYEDLLIKNTDFGSCNKGILYSS